MTDLIPILVPPLGVFLQVGFGWINILLTFLGYICLGNCWEVTMGL